MAMLVRFGVSLIVVCHVTATFAGRAAAEQTARYQFARPVMGTVFRIVLYAESEQAATAAAEAALGRVEQLDRLLSDYRRDSELSGLNRASGGSDAVDVGDDLWHVVVEGQRIAQLTDGAFDMTIGPLVRLWRRARRSKKLPSTERLQQVRRSVGFEHVQADPKRRSVRLLQPGMRLDLGGIAKGYAADEALRTLRQHAVSSALVDAGGDLALGDPPPQKEGWVVGVASPHPGERPQRYLLLDNCGIATSGDLHQHVVIDGVRYSHIVDPRTGWALTTPIHVTVIASNGMTADAWASALSVIGPEQGIELIDQESHLHAIVIRQETDGENQYESRCLSELTQVDPPTEAVD